MKSRQSSVGRELENFMIWWIPIGDRIPTNSRRLQHLADKLTDAISDTQTLVRLALKTSGNKARLEMIEAMVLNMESVRSIMDLFCEYCERHDHIHFISLKQKASYLKQMESICRQIGGWERKTRFLAAKEENEANPEAGGED